MHIARAALGVIPQGRSIFNYPYSFRHWAVRARVSNNVGYLSETIAALQCQQQLTPQGPPPQAWHEDTKAEWLICAPASFAGQRAAMIKAIRARLVLLEDQLGAQAIARALRAMAKVPRESFICPWIEDLAYLPMAHDIGAEQVISHPELVAILAAACDPLGGHVLDVGTGSGYQAAVLSGMASRVTSVEIIEAHATQARHRLRRLGYDNIEVLAGDASEPGMFAPESFAAIVVAAGASAIPAALMDALKVGGRLVMPIGATSGDEQLVLVEKRSGSVFRHETLCPARFVPLTGNGAR